MTERERHDDPHGIRLRLSAQRALLGNVPPSLRAASLEYDGSVIRCRFDFDADPSEQALESVSVVSTEILSDYADGTSIVEEVRIADEAGATSPLRHLVYLRGEPPSVDTTPAWVTRGKSIRQLIVELQSFEDSDLDVRIRADDGAAWTPISLVSKEFAGESSFCGIANCGVAKSMKR